MIKLLIALKTRSLIRIGGNNLWEELLINRWRKQPLIFILETFAFFNIHLGRNILFFLRKELLIDFFIIILLLIIFWIPIWMVICIVSFLPKVLIHFYFIDKIIKISIQDSYLYTLKIHLIDYDSRKSSKKIFWCYLFSSFGFGFEKIQNISWIISKSYDVYKS